MKNSVTLLFISLIFLLLSCQPSNKSESSDNEKKELEVLTSERIKKREGITNALKSASFKILKLNIVLGDKISPDNSKSIPNDIEKICAMNEDACKSTIIPVGTLKRLGVDEQYDLFDLNVPPAGDIERMGGAFKRQMDIYIQSAIVPDSMIVKNPTNWKVREILEKQTSSIVDSIFFFSNMPEAGENISVNGRKYKIFKDSDKLKQVITDLACQSNFNSSHGVTILYNIPSSDNIEKPIVPKTIVEKPVIPKPIVQKPVDVKPIAEKPVEKPAEKLTRIPKEKLPVQITTAPNRERENSSNPWVIEKLGECANGFREVTRKNLKTGKSKTVKERYSECDNIEPDWVKKSVNDVKQGQVTKDELGKKQQ